MQRFAVFVQGLSDVRDVDFDLPDIHFKTVQTINKIAGKYRKVGADRILTQINFPDNYLNPAQKRLFVAQRATTAKPEAIIRARGRPTSLARFVTGFTPGEKGVNLSVKRGRNTRIKNAFMIKLPAGAGSIDTKFNMGLAIRLKKGETLENKRNVVRMSKGLYLLYGPSVDQVFLNATGGRAGQGVLTEMTPDLLDDMQDEFLRLLDI